LSPYQAIPYWLRSYAWWVPTFLDDKEIDNGFMPFCWSWVPIYGCKNKWVDMVKGVTYLFRGVPWLNYVHILWYSSYASHCQEFNILSTYQTNWAWLLFRSGKLEAGDITFFYISIINSCPIFSLKLLGWSKLHTYKASWEWLILMLPTCIIFLW